MPGGAKQNNSDFMNKIEAKDLILPLFPPSNIWLSLLVFFLLGRFYRGGSWGHANVL